MTTSFLTKLARNVAWQRGYIGYRFYSHETGTAPYFEDILNKNKVVVFMKVSTEFLALFSLQFKLI